MAYHEELDDEDEGGRREPKERRIPVGRYVLQSAFKNRGWRRHYEHDNAPYMIHAAQWLMIGSKRNGVERVRVIDTLPKDYVILYEKRI